MQRRKQQDTKKDEKEVEQTKIQGLKKKDTMLYSRMKLRKEELKKKEEEEMTRKKKEKSEKKMKRN
jgi:hypothetical protein